MPALTRKRVSDRPVTWHIHYAGVRVGVISERSGVAGAAEPWAIQCPFTFEVYRGSMETVRRFLADETGATAIEYGLIAAGISLAIIAIVNGLGTKLNTKFTSINTSLH
jgi:pilus assembly protein Flp/PilA